MTSMVLAPAPHLEPLFLFLKVCILGLFFTSFSVLRFLKPQKFHMYTPFLCIAYPTLPLPLCLWNSTYSQEIFFPMSLSLCSNLLFSR